MCVGEGTQNAQKKGNGVREGGTDRGVLVEEARSESGKVARQREAGGQR